VPSFRIVALTVLLLAGVSACSGPGRPILMVRNERATSANVKFVDLPGTITRIDNVAGGTTSAAVEVDPGIYSVTAVIAGETDSPNTTLTAARDQTYTVVVLAGTPPRLQIEGPLPAGPALP
jgi:hypothetical protein